MKQVTMESVKERIARIESGAAAIKPGGMELSLQHEFELACLRELLAMTEQVRQLTEQRDAVVAENVALKSGDVFFSYGSEHGFEWHKTAKEAVENAEAAIDDYRGEACDGWSEEVDSICWGVIMQSSTKVGERPRNEDDCCDPSIDTVCDYALLPNIDTPATSAILDSLRAEVLPPNIAEIIDSGDLESICWHSSFAERERIRLALYNFRQLRESKGAQS